MSDVRTFTQDNLSAFAAPLLLIGKVALAATAYLTPYYYLGTNGLLVANGIMWLFAIEKVKARLGVDWAVFSGFAYGIMFVAGCVGLANEHLPKPADLVAFGASLGVALTALGYYCKRHAYG